MAIKKAFGAETKKILRLMIDSIYTNKSIFIRELISNASDACDKIKIHAVQENDTKLLGESLYINVTIDKNDNTITVEDNGIGMDADDLENNLGVIANSGTQNFLQALQHTFNDKQHQNDLIGQFGVGFYSGFMVADRMTVLSTKFNQEEQTYLWRSDGDGYYEIEQTTDIMHRGTKVCLSIKKEEEEFLNASKISNIITTYSDHINYPIYLICKEKVGDECAPNMEHKDPVNKNQAIWTKNPSNVTQDEYNNFYQHITHSPDQPWMILHNKVEGVMEYTNLLFIPTKRPFDLFSPDRVTRVKLYIKRVFIADDGLALIPKYMRFLRGVIDTTDLPLNVSRETLQQSTKTLKLKKAITKRVLHALKEKADHFPDEYVQFWGNFGEVLKEGLCEPMLEEKDQLLGICRFLSTKSGNGYISMDDYVKNMRDGQKAIYYLVGDDLDAMKSNPQLEGFQAKDIEVLLLQNPVDAFWVTAINDYKNYDLVSVATTDVQLICNDNADNSTDTEEDVRSSCNTSGISNAQLSQSDTDTLTSYIKSVLDTKVSNVIVSKKLVKSPACLSIPDGGMNSQLEKMLLEQKQLKKRITKVLEINPNHVVIKTILQYLRLRANSEINTEEKVQSTIGSAVGVACNLDEDRIRQLVNVVFAQACLTSGQLMENPNVVAEILDDMTIKYINL